MERVKGEDRFGEQSECEGIKKKGQQKSWRHFLKTSVLRILEHL